MCTMNVLMCVLRDAFEAIPRPRAVVRDCNHHTLCSLHAPTQSTGNVASIFFSEDFPAKFAAAPCGVASISGKSVGWIHPSVPGAV